ncbi:MAG TPA: hypothetical protein VLA36_02150 [Longimicrobiales bacterium]|nr:hypothetical protein [Longimicrobiales bacterium]
MIGLLRGVFGRSAETHPRARDVRLRGRTYAIPFDRVWSAAEAAASGECPRWTLLSANDEAGVMVAEIRTLVSRRVGDARIEIGLDGHAQTRVDIQVAMRGRRGDLGGSARVVGAFVKRLDASLQVRPDQILDATREPTWSS